MGDILRALTTPATTTGVRQDYRGRRQGDPSRLLEQTIHQDRARRHRRRHLDHLGNGSGSATRNCRSREGGRSQAVHPFRIRGTDGGRDGRTVWRKGRSSGPAQGRGHPIRPHLHRTFCGLSLEPVRRFFFPSHFFSLVLNLAAMQVDRSRRHKWESIRRGRWQQADLVHLQN